MNVFFSSILILILALESPFKAFKLSVVYTINKL